MDPVLLGFLLAFAANVASDLAHDGIGWLSRSLNKPSAPDPAIDLARLNVRLQADLVEAGVSESTAVLCADFVLHRANISFLLLLAYSAGQHQVENQRRAYQDDLRVELRAHLVLEAGVNPESADVGLAADRLAAILEAVSSSQVEAGPRSSLERSAAKPSALFLYRHAADRWRLFDSLGQPDLAAYLEYTRLYNAAASSHYGELQIQHLGANVPAVPIDSIYVQPTFSQRVGDVDAEQGLVYGMKQALSVAPRKVILGPAGIGKSTFVRFTASRIAQLGADGTIAPLVIELRKFKARPEARLFVEYLEEQAATLVQVSPPSGWLQYLLLSGRSAVFFDGFDEVLDLGDRAVVRDSIRSFAELYVASDVIVTSRLNGYDAAPFPKNEFECLQVRNFDEDRVRRYAEKWFEQRPRGTDPIHVDSFVEESGRYAGELRRNPLMLSLLCNVYFYRGDIPKSLSELYDRCSAMMFQEWDAIRGIDDHGAWDRNIRPSLFRLALTILNNVAYRGEGMPRADIERELARQWLDETVMDAEQASEEARRVVELWTGRAWIITAVGADERNQPLYGFVHQSFLEYFAATALSRNSDSPEALFDNIRTRILSVNGWAVAQMAVSVFDFWHAQGGSRLIEVALERMSNSSVYQREIVVGFAVEMLGVVRMSRAVEERIFAAALSVFAESVLLPQPGQSLYQLHEESRFIHARASDELEELDESFLVEPADGGVSSDPDAYVSELSTLDTEYLVHGVVRACLDSDARRDLLLDTMKAWTPEIDPAQAMVTVAYVANLVEPQTDLDAVREVTESFAQSSYGDHLNWMFYAACVTSGVAEDREPQLRLPWNVQFVRDPLVLSYVRDFDMPAVVAGEALALLTDPSKLRHLRAIGASFIELEATGDWEEFVYDGRASIALPTDGPVTEIDTSSWDEAAFVGAFVLLAVYLEVFGASVTAELFGSRADAVAALLRSMLEGRDPSNVGPAWPQRLRDYVDWWEAGSLRLTQLQQ